MQRGRFHREEREAPELVTRLKELALAELGSLDRVQPLSADMELALSDLSFELLGNWGNWNQRGTAIERLF
jgi:hypothetical protein